MQKRQVKQKGKKEIVSEKGDEQFHRERFKKEVADSIKFYRVKEKSEKGSLGFISMGTIVTTEWIVLERRYE